MGVRNRQERQAYPTFVNVIEFLETLCRAFEASATTISASKPSPSATKRTGSTQVHHASSESTPSCLLCKEAHPLRSCGSFHKLTIAERWDLVAKKQLCFNCMSDKHRSASCTTVFSCRICKQKHHTMLHPSSASAAVNHTTSSPVENTPCPTPPVETIVATLCSNSIQKSRQIMLATAVAYVQTSFGRQPVRMLIDPGSESSFVRKRHKSALQVLEVRRLELFLV